MLFVPRMWLPVVTALRNGNVGMARFLLDSCGAELDAWNTTGVESFLFAVSNGHEDVVGFLLERGISADVALSEDGPRALHKALESGHFRIARMLVKAGARLLRSRSMERLQLARRKARSWGYRGRPCWCPGNPNLLQPAHRQTYEADPWDMFIHEDRGRRRQPRRSTTE